MTPPNGPTCSARIPATRTSALRGPARLLLVLALCAGGLALSGAQLAGPASWDHSTALPFVARSTMTTAAPQPTSLGSVVASIPVWGGPAGIDFDSSNGHLFVANANSNNVSIIDGSTNAVVGAVTLPNVTNYPANPWWVLADPSNHQVYVGDQGDYALSVIDATTGTNLTWAQEPQYWDVPNGMTLDTTTSTLWVAINDASVDGGVTYLNSIAPFSTTTDTWGAPLQMSNDNFPLLGACFDPTNGYVYALQTNGSGSYLPSQITVINAATSSVVTTIPTVGENDACAYDATNGNIYVITQGNAVGGSYTNLSVLNPSSNTIASNINFGYGNYQAAVIYDAATGYLYSAGASSISVVDPSTASILGTIPVCVFPTGTGSPANLAVDTTNGDIYVTCGGIGNYGKVDVINPSASGATLTSVSVTMNPASGSISTGGTVSLSSSLTCSGGSCPSGASYAWSLGLTSLGSLSSSSASSTTFQAGSSTGTEPVTLQVSLGGVQKSTTVTILIGSGGGGGGATLTGVGLSASTATIAPSGSTSFTATPSCSPSPCPSTGLVYAWTLNNSLGSLSSSTGATTTFTAGSATGLVGLTVTVVLNGQSQHSSAVITISTSAPSNGGSGGSSSGFLGMSGDLGYVVVGVAGAAVVGVVVAILLLRARKPPVPGTGSAPAPAIQTTPPPPPA